MLYGGEERLRTCSNVRFWLLADIKTAIEICPVWDAKQTHLRAGGYSRF